MAERIPREQSLKQDHGAGAPFGKAASFVRRTLERLAGLLTGSGKVPSPGAPGVEEAAYDSVLVAFDERSGFSEDVVATAARLAATRRRAIHVLSLITVPSSLPISSDMKRSESEAASKIERAKLIAGMRVTGEVERVRPGQAGYAIAEKARRIRAGAIVIGLRERDGVPLYDDTVKSVLAERPCRVIVVSPGAAAESGAYRTVRR